jgi:hypothetical protein
VRWEDSIRLGGAGIRHALRLSPSQSSSSPVVLTFGGDHRWVAFTRRDAMRGREGDFFPADEIQTLE